jgi:hypothetical protein
MAKALDYTFELPYGVEDMFAEGTDPAFIEAQGNALNHYGIELLTLENGPEGGRALARYEVDVELPSWARKFLQPRNKVTETRTWGPAAADGTRSYTVEVKLENVPIQIKGVIGLKPVGDKQTLNTVHMDVKAALPIFGAKLEELVESDLKKNIQGEVDFTASWMRSHGF